jgi:hypothetical protein
MNQKTKATTRYYDSTWYLTLFGNKRSGPFPVVYLSDIKADVSIKGNFFISFTTDHPINVGDLVELEGNVYEVTSKDNNAFRAIRQ